MGLHLIFGFWIKRNVSSASLNWLQAVLAWAKLKLKVSSLKEFLLVLLCGLGKANKRDAAFMILNVCKVFFYIKG